MFNELFYRLALRYLPFYNNVFINQLIKKFITATDIFRHSESYFSRFQFQGNLLKPCLSPEIISNVNQELAWMEQNGVSFCFYNDPDYPFRLKECRDAPYGFYYKGEPCFNSPKIVAVVGTRNMSEYGKEMVKRVVKELADYDIVIVSGLAEGIDTKAHQEALHQQQKTVAVLGSGLGLVYPSSNRKLAETIATKGGVLISEYPHYTKPDRLHFPLRNRIIAGLSDAALVVETPARGGSMITAYTASAYNRDVFAIPGNILSDNQEGCHQLIRKNIAALVTSGEELAEMMGWNREI